MKSCCASRRLRISFRTRKVRSIKHWSLPKLVLGQTRPPHGRTCMPNERKITYSAALNEALREEMRRDSNVFIMGEEVSVWGDVGGVFGVTKGLTSEFG